MHLLHDILEQVLGDAAAGHGSAHVGNVLVDLPAAGGGGLGVGLVLGRVDLAAHADAQAGGALARGVLLEVLGDEEVEVVLVGDLVRRGGAVLGGLEGDLDTAGVGPVLGVYLFGLEDGLEAQAGAGVGDLAGEGVADGEGGAHAAALGAGARGVKVDGVDALVAGVGAALLGRDGAAVGRVHHHLLHGLLGGGGRRGRGRGRGRGIGGGLGVDSAHDVVVVKVVEVDLLGIRDHVRIAVGDFFYSGVRHCVTVCRVMAVW